MIIAVMTFFLLIGTVSVVGNIVVLFVVYKSKQLRHSQYIYKCSIAISDVIWGFSISTFFISTSLRYMNLKGVSILEKYDNTKSPDVTIDKNNFTTYRHEIQEAIFYLDDFNKDDRKWFLTFIYYVLQYVTPITLFVSFISLVFASIDRFVALAFPFRYKQINSIKLAKIVSAFIWLFTAAIHTVTIILCFESSGTPSLLFQPIDYSFSEFPTYSLHQNITAAVLFMLFSVLWVLTCLTLCSLYKSYKRSLTLNRKALKGLSLEKQMSLVLIFMVLGFTFSLFPTIYSHIYLYLYNKEFKGNIFNPKTVFISVAFLTTNSVWNFLIYNILNKKFRSALNNVCLKCK